MSGKPFTNLNVRVAAEIGVGGYSYALPIELFERLLLIERFLLSECLLLSERFLLSERLRPLWRSRSGEAVLERKIK